ncbi:MAG: EthD family reductase [Gammaproteobacteria bacterium]|nr:EthD family reductase [Gammaproteobacteria bacterium]
MLKIMFLVKRKATLDKDAFSKYWREAHAPIAGRIPGLRKYIQHHVVSGVGGATPPFDGIAEMWYDNGAALENAMATPEGQAAQADAEKCMDLESMLVMNVEQTAVI